ncbi:peptidase S9 prolyl oligopeptidase [Glycocaulis alkaliphilus]|uniref:Peptidase S9 prolyl oligopeptidase n=1 Tax=Glycocaulis alkaliphilus TaxID=1434191 RepID=A0A3T0ECY0_9PROT|nr:S9 family peptidase [Glycocaulis alkaliphilus]AZU05144.1 peptidase S9 prolyl oligopeptidase [Glycocaulis alkaliphilus]GGB64912.1 peptidase S9 [Glycocaulis alkaliphilus]
MTLRLRHRLAAAMIASAFIAVPAAMTPALAQEQAEARSVSINDLFELRQAGQVLIAPATGQLAFTVSVPRDIRAGDSDGAPSLHLYAADAPGALRALVAGDNTISAVALHPDGESVTFMARREGDERPALYRVALSGGEPERLYHPDTGVQGYLLSADASSIYFIGRDPNLPDTSALRERGFRANVYEENQPVSYVWRAGLGDNERAAEPLALAGHASAIQLSADGSTLAVTLAPTPSVDDSMMEQRWSFVDTQSGDVISTVETPGKIDTGRFSPDGSQFAFLAAINRSDSTAGTIHVADVQSGEYIQIAPDAEQHIRTFEWHDGQILALAHVRQDSAWVVYTPEGEEVSREAHGGYVAHSLSLDGDSGQIAFVADSPSHPRDVYVARPGEAPARWADLNPWLANRTLGEQRVVRWTARDGVEVEGVLITPQGEAPENGWPMIAVVHGGPEAHDHNGWLTGYSRPGQIGAGEGFAVFYPNYRGSTGRGFAFIELDHLNPPGEEFEDIVDGVGYLANQGVIDPARVGITGGSYGGFASAWGATVASEHFAASVPFVALTDLVSFMGNTDIPVEMVDVHFIHYPWENWEWYFEHSPIMHAHGSTTPTLVMHGEVDTRVAPSQGYILYRYLKLAGEAPVRLVTYPGEGHGLRNAAAQFDYAHRLMGWMRHYLQGPGGEIPSSELDYDALLGAD